MSHFSPLLWLYQFATLMFTPFWPLLLLWRLRKGKEDRARWHERRGWPSKPRPEGSLIWVHCASVGELNAAMPLIEKLAEKYPSLLVTTGTITSAYIAANRLPAGVIHQFVPLDCPRYVTRFFKYWKPNFGVLVESELWPNLLTIGRRQGCHFVLVNGRMSDRSYKRWHSLAPNTIKALLAQLDMCLCQSQQDTERFLHLGAMRAATIGNLKYDATLPTPAHTLVTQLEVLTRGRPIVLAASTHPGEEISVMKMHSALMEQFPKLLTIIVPRHPHRGAEIAELASTRSLTSQMRSQGEIPEKPCNIYIADTIGEMSLFFHLATLVVMGGSLVPVGGHNPIEPAILKKPILSGIYTQNFSEIFEILDAKEAVVRVNSAEDLTFKVQTLLTQTKAQKQLGQRAFDVVSSQKGAVERTLQSLEPFLLDCAMKPK